MEKVKTIANLIKMLNFSKEDVRQLVKYLLSAYELSDDNKVCEARPAQAKSVLPLEVVYQDGSRSYEKICGKIPVGILLQGKYLLFPQESGCPFSRSEAQRYMNNLPAGYRWHLMTEKEARVIKRLEKSAEMKSAAETICWPMTDSHPELFVIWLRFSYLKPPFQTGGLLFN